MSYKQHVPETSEDWDTYWQQTSIDKELSIVKTDGLQPIFEKYLDKNGIHIEAGCGLGKWVIDLHNKGYQIVGIDTYVKGLYQLKKFDQNLSLAASDVAKLGLKSDSIDSYISLGVVEHFEEGPRQPIAEAFRVVKPEGIALIEVPYDSPLRQLSRILFQLKVLLKLPVKLLVEGLKIRPKRPKIEMKFYEYRYTRSELEQFVKQAGFELVETLPKDDLDKNRSIMLWSDYTWLRHQDGKLFHLNRLGTVIKSILNLITPFTYSALIVCIARKPK